MQSRTEQVRTAMDRCAACFMKSGRDPRQRTERAEELWFEMEDAMAGLAEAEAGNDMKTVHYHTSILLNRALRLQNELQSTRR